MSNNYLAIAENAEMGKITRDFTKALSRFVEKSEQEISAMTMAVNNFSIQGNDELPSEIRRSMSSAINAIADDVSNLQSLIPQLNDKANGYDDVVKQLYEALRKLK